MEKSRKGGSLEAWKMGRLEHRQVEWNECGINMGDFHRHLGFMRCLKSLESFCTVALMY